MLVPSVFVLEVTVVSLIPTETGDGVFQGVGVVSSEHRVEDDGVGGGDWFGGWGDGGEWWSGETDRGEEGWVGELVEGSVGDCDCCHGECVGVSM